MPSGIYERTTVGRLKQVKRPVFERDGVLFVPLTRGLFALASPEDRPQLENYNWSAQRCDKSFYAARRSLNAEGKTALVLMHRQLLGLAKGQLGDHRNGNKLDNRRSNLRAASASENARNRSVVVKSGRRAGSSIGVIHVPEHSRSRPWLAYISHNKKRFYLGYFSTEPEAARARDEAAKEMHGTFATLNFK